MTKDEIVEFAEAVAAHLDGYTASAPPDGLQGAYLTDSNGRRLYMHRRQGSKVEIRSSYGDLAGFIRWDETEPCISVSLGRNPQHVAADIRRRLLPDSAAYWDTLTERKREHDVYHGDVGGKARALADLFPGAQLYAADKKSGRWEIDLRHTDTGYGTVKVWQGSVDLDLHNVPHDVAARILRVLAEGPSSGRRGREKGGEWHEDL